MHDDLAGPGRRGLDAQRLSLLAKSLGIDVEADPQLATVMVNTDQNDVEALAGVDDRGGREAHGKQQ